MRKKDIKKNKSSIFYLSLLSILLIASFTFAFTQFSIPVIPSTSSEITYNSLVCTSVERADGSYEELGCSHNLVTDDGLEAIRNTIGQGGTYAAFDYIALCNASNACGPPLAADSTCENELTGLGVGRTQGTYGTIGTGNWSVYTTFTATGDNIETNKTCLFNNSAADALFAENTFSLVTLQTDDQLTVNWTIFVESG